MRRRRLRAGALSAAERSYPISEVRGRGLECQAATAQEWPRGATLRLRSEAAGRSLLAPRPGAVTLRSHPEPEARGGSWEEPPRPQARASQGAVAAQAHEGQEELSQVEGEERRQ